jgi:DNA-binding response OmpR family regulator
MKCPCCGGEVPQTDRPLVSLDTNTISAAGKTAVLSGREAEVAHLLARAMPFTLDTERLISGIYGGVPADDAYNCIKNFVRLLRRKVEPLGLTIVNTYGKGHAMKWMA